MNSKGKGSKDHPPPVPHVSCVCVSCDRCCDVNRLVQSLQCRAQSKLAGNELSQLWSNDSPVAAIRQWRGTGHYYEIAMLSLSARAVQIFVFIIPPAGTMIVSARESARAIPVWQCLCNGTLINPHDVIPSHNNVTDTGRANSVIWPSYPGGKLTTAGCDSNFTLVNLLQCCYDERTEVCWPTFQITNTHISSPQLSSQAVKRSLLGSKM